MNDIFFVDYYLKTVVKQFIFLSVPISVSVLYKIKLRMNE